MADKSFGVKELNLLNASGTPTVTSPNNLNLNANTVAISTSCTIGNNLTVTSTTNSANLNVTGIGTLTRGFATDLSVSGISTISQPSNANPHSLWDVVNNGSSAYRFTGPGQSGDENNPNIYLVRGQRYIFKVNASGHPFQLRVANGGAAYSDGVTNNGAQSGNVVFNVQHDAPAQLYYQCTSHGGMVGNIYIVGGPQVISGVVTATSFSGSGANLTSLPAQATIANNADNRVITGGSGVNLNGEANLTFDGSTLGLTGVFNSGGNVNCTSGRFQRGSSTVQDGDAIAGGININGTDMDASVIMSIFGNDGDFTRISGSKSRNASVGSHTIVQNNDVLLSLKGFGSDGTNFEEAAQIEMQVDGTPNNNVMPGRIVFKTTTTDGVAERLRITSDGKIGIGENNPTREFVLKNAGGNCQLSITSGTSNSAYLNLGDTDDDNIGSIYYDNSNNRIVFRANTTDIVRMESDGNIRILDGNLRIATAGHGIDFSAAADDSTNLAETVDSSILDDYEEGQFTPAVQFDVGGGSISYGTRYGRYRKVGNMVHITYYMEIASGVSSSDYFARLSLPFNGYGGAVGHQDARIRQWNTGVSDWFVSLGGSAPVFFMNNGNGSSANYARGDDINGYKLSGQYTLYT